MVALNAIFQRGCQMYNSSFHGRMHAMIKHHIWHGCSGLPTDHVQGLRLIGRYFETNIFGYYIHSFEFRTKQINHDTLKATRIGEASNPGPECYVDVCLVNPTAIANRKELLCSLQADVLALAETSATAMLQSEFNQAIKDTPYSVFWGHPVEDKVKISVLRDGRPSRRGEALGTAIMTRVPARRSRIEGDSVLRQSCRFVPCICYLGEIEVLIVAAYFFPDRTLEAQAQNEILLSHIYDYVARSDIPFVIAADFNQNIHTLSAWKAFQHLGCEEGFQSARHRLGIELPPTCRNSTRFDSFIFHPTLTDLLVDMWVGPEHMFADHSPIYARFEVRQVAKVKRKLFVPADWSSLTIDHKCFDKQYKKAAQEAFLDSHIASASNPEQKMHIWSKTIEHALDQTLRCMHRENPVLFPLKNLPSKFRGRCAPPRFLTTTPNRSVKQDATALFDPVGEPTALRNCHKARQTRRLMSLSRQISRQLQQYSSWDHVPVPKQHNLQSEWECIRKAQGYGASWEHWVLGFEIIPFVPMSLPSLPLLHNLVQLTKHDAEIAFRQEEKTVGMQINNQQEKNGALVFKALRDPEQKVIIGMPCQVQVEARLLRLSKGSIRILIASDQSFRKGEAQYGSANIRITRQDRRFIDLVLLSGSLATKATLSQSRYSQDIDKMSKDFFNFWAPMWLRDTKLEASDENMWESTFPDIFA